MAKKNSHPYKKSSRWRSVFREGNNWALQFLDFPFFCMYTMYIQKKEKSIPKAYTNQIKWMTLGAHPIVHIKIPKPVAFSEIPLPSTMYIYTSTIYHIQHYSKLRKNVRVTQSQNVPSSSLSQPVADRQAEAG